MIDCFAKGAIKNFTPLIQNVNKIAPKYSSLILIWKPSNTQTHKPSAFNFFEALTMIENG